MSNTRKKDKLIKVLIRRNDDKSYIVHDEKLHSPKEPTREITYSAFRSNKYASKRKKEKKKNNKKKVLAVKHTKIPPAATIKNDSNSQQENPNDLEKEKPLNVKTTSHTEPTSNLPKDSDDQPSEKAVSKSEVESTPSLDTAKTTELHRAAKTGNLNLVKFLVKNKANIMALDEFGHTPEEVAAENKHQEIVDYLQNKVIYRQLRTQQKFFAYSRNKNQTLDEQISKFYSMFFNKKSNPVNITDFSHRSLVVSNATALECALHELAIDQLNNTQSIVEKTKWYNGGYLRNGKVNQAWSWEYIEYMLENRTQSISSQFKPVPGQLGNFRMTGIPQYGDDFLNIIYKITKTKSFSESKNREAQLAKLFIYCSSEGCQITKELLKQYQLDSENIDTKLIKKLNNLLILTSIKEVTRRLNGSSIDLPISIAHLEGLLLVAEGHLRMEDLYGKDAQYGIPTAKSLNSSLQYNRAINKLKNLNLLFAKHFGEIDFSRESFHQLLYLYGGEGDSEGEEYLTSDEEDFQIETSKGSLKIE